MTNTTRKVTEHEIRDIAHDARIAFWDTVAKRLPDTLTGDGDPIDEEQFAAHCETVVRRWVRDNVESGVYFGEWETIEFPKFLRDCGFEDRSYHNDLNARAELPLEGYTEENGYPALTCWVEHEAVADREFPDYPRFRLEANLTAASGDPQDLNVLYEGEDPIACEDAIQKYLGAILTRAESKEATDAR